jgi:hypothetical protein
MELLGKIFGDPSRVKLMRLFLWSEGTPFTLEQASHKSQVKLDQARKELTQLTSIGFLTKKTFFEKVPVATKKTKKPTKAKDHKEEKPQFKKVSRTGWVLNLKFELIEPLRNLLIETELVRGTEILRKLREAGKIELLLLSGVFVRDENRKLDILVVGNNLNTQALEKQILVLESEVGRELSYSHFTVDEFNYRQGMYDKLLRDVLENHHTTLVNNILR